MRRFSLLGVVVVALVAAGCFGDSGGAGDTKQSELVTTTSLAGVHLGETPARVNSVLGPGRILRSDLQSREARYRDNVTVYYYSDGIGTPRVFLVGTTSPRFHTASGVRVGSSLSMVKALGHLDCGTVRSTRVECIPDALGHGLRFDLINGRVIHVWLVDRNE